ncbi:Bromodomain-containing protein 8 [Linnemannia hyalina]|uniref:Bromodomain-containing protein 8 n=1 Tax=Linnemannia hyalina TaxID=64524 RepID=A0A9P7Y1I4_9FUNG|nr:Bromodomain-containing protein 8 [Linnemannia hyalina]
MSDVTTTPTSITAAADIKSDSEPWSVLENLILAQAIYKCGDTNWVAIARTIKGHPQIHRSSNFFSQKSCAIQYTLLLENLETETSRSKQTRANDADIPTVVKLAGQLYNQRILEIKALIRKDEERFRALVAELDDIRQGKWDNQLEEELKKNPPPPEPEQEPEPSTNEAATLSAETSQQPQQDGEPLQIDTAAPLPLSSPVSLTSLEKPEDASQAMQEAAPKVEQPVTSTASSTEEVLENQTRSELKDVEMEEAGEPESTSETPVVSAPTPVALSNTPAAGDVDEDVEMEDITSTDSPSVVSEAVTPVEVIKSTTVQDEGSNLKVEVDNGSIASSPTSASDLSPPGAMEEEEDEDEENGEEDDTPKKEPVSSSPAGDKTKDDSEVDESDQVKEGDSVKEEEVDKEANEEADEEEDEEADKDENADREMEVESRGSPDGSSEAGDGSKMDEDVAVKSEDPTNDTEQEEEEEEEEDAAKDGNDEGATSADEEEEEEEEAVTKSPKKPRKIKTSVPVKRKRRSGRGGADVEDGYNSSDSEATESVSNMSDQRNQMDDKKWKKILMIIWTEITNHRYGAVFMQPIKEHDAPGYYLMIKRPMDLKSIKERIRDGQITNADEFHRDVLLMFMNALMYNGEDTEVYQMAMAMMTEVEQIIKNFKSSQSFAPTGVSGGTGGSGNASSSTTPTTRTAGSDGLLGTTSSSSGQPSSRRRKSSGMEITPIE